MKLKESAGAKPPTEAPKRFEGDLWGMPGERGSMILVNHYKDPADPRNQGIPGGLPGKYRAVITLARPGRPLTDEYEKTFEAGLKGDSHIAITEPAFSPPDDPKATHIRGHGIGVDGMPHEWTGFPNDRGFLGKIRIEPFEAVNVVDAERRAYRIVAPSLSNWSAHLDIPVHVAQIDVVEVRTGNTQMSFINPWREMPFAVAGEVSLEPEYRSAVSLYREALESSSLVYRFLCLFKIIESILALRVRRERHAREEGRPFSRPPEVVPQTRAECVQWLNGIFAPRPPKWDDLIIDEVLHPQASGKSFEELVHTGKKRGSGGILRQLRHDVAHALWEEGGGVLLSMSADELLNHTRVNEWLPLTRCIARYMLKHEFPDQFLRHLRDDGTLLSESELTKGGNHRAAQEGSG